MILMELGIFNLLGYINNIMILPELPAQLCGARELRTRLSHMSSAGEVAAAHWVTRPFLEVIFNFLLVCIHRRPQEL